MEKIAGHSAVPRNPLSSRQMLTSAAAAAICIRYRRSVRQRKDASVFDGGGAGREIKAANFDSHRPTALPLLLLVLLVLRAVRVRLSQNEVLLLLVANFLRRKGGRMSTLVAFTLGNVVLDCSVSSYLWIGCSYHLQPATVNWPIKSHQKVN